MSQGSRAKSQESRGKGNFYFSLFTFLFSLLFVILLSSCQRHVPDVEFFGKKGDSEMFEKELFARVDGVEQPIEVSYTDCMLLTAQEDFNGDGVRDALVTNIQAFGGNALGNNFFFVSRTDDGRFVLSDFFGESVYDDPVVETWQGRPAVVFTDTRYDEYTEDYESWQERYVLIDTFAVRAVSPESVTLMPGISVEEWQRLSERMEMGKGTDEDSVKLSDCDVFYDLYNEGCSWYCGGEVQELTATACRKAEGDVTYEGTNAHDFDHESVWASKSKGVGESLIYRFAGNCPRITTIKILNGDVKSDEAWQSSSRVKMLKMYVNDKPYALLALEDSRSLQCFEIGTVGYHLPDAPDWTLRFEVVEIYPGSQRNASMVIAELFFDGIDVH